MSSFVIVFVVNLMISQLLAANYVSFCNKPLLNWIELNKQLYSSKD